MSTRPDQAHLVALTEHVEPELARHLLSVGVSAYLLKRSSLDEVVRGVRAAIGGTPYLDPAVRHEPKQRTNRPPSARELTVLKLSALGAETKKIASRLGLSHRTVEVHKANAMRKYGLNDRAELLRFAGVRGWLR